MDRDDTPMHPFSHDARDWMDDALAKKRHAEEIAASATDADDRLAGAFYDAYRGVHMALMALLKDGSKGIRYTTDLDGLIKVIEPRLALRTLTVPRDVVQSVGKLSSYDTAHAWPMGEASRRALELKDAVLCAGRTIGWIERTHSALDMTERRDS